MILHSFNHDEDLSDLLDRVLDNGIVIEPWARVSLGEPGRVRLDHCVAVNENCRYDQNDNDEDDFEHPKAA